MQPFLERIERGQTLLADGAMGTLLLDRGLEPGQCPEALNLTCPEVLEEIAGLYLRAGAEIVQTNTFGGSPARLASYDLSDQAEEINHRAVVAARRAVGAQAYVSGSCGPSGKMLKPHGDAEPQDLYESFARQMRALIHAGADLICVETMTDLAEATLAVRAARDLSPNLPVMATMTFQATPKGYYTIMGVDIAAAAGGLAEAGANLVGSNCGHGIENMIEIARAFRRCSDLPLVIQSNAGLPRTEGGRTVYDQTPEFMAERAGQLLAEGVSVIGGCCGTTPQHIRALRNKVDSLAGH